MAFYYVQSKQIANSFVEDMARTISNATRQRKSVTTINFWRSSRVDSEYVCVFTQTNTA